MTRPATTKTKPKPKAKTQVLPPWWPARLARAGIRPGDSRAGIATLKAMLRAQAEADSKLPGTGGPKCETCHRGLTVTIHFKRGEGSKVEKQTTSCPTCERILSMKPLWKLSPGLALRKPNFDEPGRALDNVVKVTPEVARRSELLGLEWVEDHGLCGRFRDPKSGKDDMHRNVYLQPIDLGELGLKPT